MMIELNGSKFQCCVKVDAYEIYTDVNYLPSSEMGQMAMLHLN